MKPEESAWREGPPKWIYTAFGVLLAAVHLALAGFDVGRFFDLFEGAWGFYASLIAITSTSAVAIHLAGSRRSQGAGASWWAADPSATGFPVAAESLESSPDGLDLDLPTPPRR